MMVVVVHSMSIESRACVMRRSRGEVVKAISVVGIHGRSSKLPQAVVLRQRSTPLASDCCADAAPKFDREVGCNGIWLCPEGSSYTEQRLEVELGKWK